MDRSQPGSQESSDPAIWDTTYQPRSRHIRPVHFDTSAAYTGGSALHAEELPGSRHTFEFMLAPVFESNDGPGDQVRNGP